MEVRVRVSQTMAASGESGALAWRARARCTVFVSCQPEKFDSPQ